MEKTKKVDKSLLLDPHREFLDMDTDEEDFGRQGLFSIPVFRTFPIVESTNRLINKSLINAYMLLYV